jgi:hypothetical protein
MSSLKPDFLRSLGAYACLLAVMLIYAPQGMIAWWAGTGACCKAEYCPIHEHHRSNAAASTEHDGMNCEHDAAGKAALAACTMSCCHDTEKVLVTPVIFLPGMTSEPAKIFLVARVAASLKETHERIGSKPLSPPPRTSVAAA